MLGTLRAGEYIAAQQARSEIRFQSTSIPASRRKQRLCGAVVALGALLMVLGVGTPALAEFDTDKWASRRLKCDGFEDNRCFRYVDKRRRNKPYLQQPRKYVEEPDRYIVKTIEPRRYGHYKHSHFYHYPRHYRRYADLYYGRPKYHKHYGHDHWGRGRWDRDRWDRWDDRWDRDRDRWDRDDKWAYRTHDGRYERQCLFMITTKGAEAQTENGALISAKRAWRASVRADYGERYQDLNHSRRAEYRCWRSSTNESALGRAGEWLTGQYRKRCQVWAVPCLGERQRLESDQDDKE